MLFIPIRTDSPVRRPPIVNQAIIGLNVLVYLASQIFLRPGEPGGLGGLRTRLTLNPEDLELFQFFSYQFLHGDFWHLFGNMLFLWVFGNSVNSKMGNVSYLFFYLSCGVFAGAAFVIGAEAPCVGASGAIAGVTTAFLVLFPRSGVTVFYWLWLYVGTVQVQALLLIVIKIILWDNIISPNLSPGGGFVQVAYSAHIAGYVFGFTWCSLMLLVRALPRDQYDVVALIKRYNQRRQYRAMMADPNERARATYGRVARRVSAATGQVVEDAPSAGDDEIVRLRAEIGEMLNRHEYTQAAQRYAALVDKDPAQCLPRGNMLAVANQLMASGMYPQAAGAYEKFLEHYPADQEAEQIKLVLGIIYAKYLQRYELAEGYLRDCLTSLSRPDQVQQARHWLEAAAGASGRGTSPA